MKKHFNKELVMTKQDSEDFENSAKCWICVNDYIDNDVKVIDHCHITGKYRGSAHRDCNINLKLIFYNLKIYDSDLIMQKLGRFSVKIFNVEHHLNVCKTFEMKIMKYYHDLYLRCEVLSLADVFEKFRNNSLKNYGLCPSH